MLELKPVDPPNILKIYQDISWFSEFLALLKAFDVVLHVQVKITGWLWIRFVQHPLCPGSETVTGSVLHPDRISCRKRKTVPVTVSEPGQSL